MSDDDYDEFDDEEEEEEDLIGKYIGDRNVLKQRHGKGWAILPNGDQYDGDYRRGQRHGIGLYVFQNGARYLGRYRCGKKSGEGKFFYPDGSIYEGSWKKNLRHGQGIYKYPNEDFYQGNWHKGLRHGLGCYCFKESNVCFRGTWNQGVPVGPAELHFRNFKYHGSWDYQYPQGPGVFSFVCKYMLMGYHRSEPSELPLDEEINEEIELEGEDEENQKSNEPPKLIGNLIPPSIWYAQSIEKYNYSKLPQQAVPMPMSDSEESICDLSIDWSEETELPLGEPEPCEIEECNIECEQGGSNSPTSTDLCSIDYKDMI